MDNVYLYNVDDLQTIADDYLKQRREEVAQRAHFGSRLMRTSGDPWEGPTRAFSTVENAHLDQSVERAW